MLSHKRIASLILVVFFTTVLVLGFAATGWATSLLFIGNGADGSCPTGTEPGCPNDPNSSLSPAQLSIFLNGTTSTVLSNPLILLIGIPTGGDFDVYPGTAPTISSVDYYDNFSVGDTPTNSVTFGTVPLLGPDGFLDPVDKDVYSASGYNHAPNDSNSYTNWAGAENSLFGLTPANFALFAYRLNENLGGQDLFNVTWAGAGLPLGTFAVGYGCVGLDGDCLDGSCLGGVGNTYATPFTEAGVATPEPATVLLLGSGLAGLVAFRKKFRKK